MFYAAASFGADGETESGNTSGDLVAGGGVSNGFFDDGYFCNGMLSNIGFNNNAGGFRVRHEQGENGNCIGFGGVAYLRKCVHSFKTSGR